MEKREDPAAGRRPEPPAAGRQDSGARETGAMESRPKVSVCVPAYNNEAEVRRLFASLAAQTMQDMEIILTDDSTDGKVGELAEWIRTGAREAAGMAQGPGQVFRDAPCMKRLRYVHNEKPLGHIFNWNKALSLAEGEYIKIMFSDDWFTEKDSLEKLTALLDDNPRASLAFCGTRQVSKKRTWERAAGKDYVDRLRREYRYLFLGNEIGAPSATLYRACGAAFDERSSWASDMFLYFEILRKNPVFVCTAEPLISIGVHEQQYTESFSGRDIRKYRDSLLMYEKYRLEGLEECRKEMLRLNVVYGQGMRAAMACGASRGEYRKQRVRWFWENTVLGYGNALLYKLGFRR